MQLTISYKLTTINLNTYHNGDLVIRFDDSKEVLEKLFEQIYLNMSQENLINWIGPQEFESLIKYYKEEYDGDTAF